VHHIYSLLSVSSSLPYQSSLILSIIYHSLWYVSTIIFKKYPPPLLYLFLKSSSFTYNKFFFFSFLYFQSSNTNFLTFYFY
jgi:hypothetical protein